MFADKESRADEQTHVPRDIVDSDGDSSTGVYWVIKWSFNN
jgi:hypothetical protein